MDFAILGSVWVRHREEPITLRGKQRTLLGALLLNANTVISRERLIAALWDEPPDSAVANLQTYVSQLRRCLRGTALTLKTDGSGYVCELATDQLDLLVFDDRTRRGRRAVERGELALADREFSSALSLWRGSPAEDARLGCAMAPRIAEIEERLATVRSEWIDVRLALGHADDLISDLGSLVADHPLRERLWAQLMLALHMAGRRAEALDAFRKARSTLVNELGVEPGHELNRLHAALLDDALPLPAAVSRSTLWEPVYQLPADIGDFVGRRSELDALLPLLSPDARRSSPAIVTLSGLPGVGKSTLAVHLAHLLRPAYPDGQLFARLGHASGDPRDPGDLLAELLHSLDVDDTRLPDSAEKRAALLRQRLADRAVLIVLDDATDERQVRLLLPGTARAAVIITSRMQLPALEGAVQVVLDLPSEEDARLLLEKVTVGTRLRDVPEAAEAILRACDRLPLAIRVSGARLASRPAWPPHEFAGRLENDGRRLDELVAGELNVRATFMMSYTALPGVARRAFRMLGLARLESAAEWSVAALLGTSMLAADRALETLTVRGMLSLTEIDSAGQPRYRLHDLLHVFAVERAEAEESPAQRNAALNRHIVACLDLARVAARDLPAPTAPPFSGPVTGSFQDRGRGPAWLAAERHILSRTVEMAVELGDVRVAAELAYHLTAHLNMYGFLDEVERVQHMVMAAATRAGDADAALRTGLVLAEAILYRSRFPEAAAEFDALAVALEQAADPHGLAYALISRAACDHGRGRYDDALATANRAITLLEKLKGLDDENGLQYAWAWPIWIHIDQGKYAQAKELCRQRLELTRDNTGFIRANLRRAFGTACYLSGEATEAVEHYLESLRLSRAIGHRMASGKVLRRLGEALGALGRFAEALDALTECMHLFQQSGDTIGEALTAHALGAVRLLEGRPREALTHFRHAHELLGSEGPRIWRARVLRDAGTAHAALGARESAVVAWKEALILFDGTPEADEVARLLA